MNGYDLDGVLTAGIVPQPPWVCISGRTHAEAGNMPPILEQAEGIYFRGDGFFGDGMHAGIFKAWMIDQLGVTDFWEDDPMQAQAIRERCPNCRVHLVTP